MEKQLVIKGHETRGKEVIEILQMLGARNTRNYTGSYPSTLYVLNDNDINLAYTCDYDNQEIFKLEDFLRKYPFKIGDKVINDNYRGRGIIKEMVWDSSAWEVKYRVNFFEDFGENAWCKHDEIKISNICLIDKADLIDKKADICLIDKADPLHELCESKTSTLIINSEVCDDEVELILNDYEIVIKDGKTFAVKKKPKYPTTYEECCDVLKIPKEERYIDIDVPLSYNNLIYKFTELLICQDAYWKIAGDEMGLGKSWEPDWEKSDSGYVYCIVNKCNNIGVTCEWLKNNYILSFPTIEMRDEFYKNFKDLIEKCKKLL